MMVREVEISPVKIGAARELVARAWFIMHGYETYPADNFQFDCDLYLVPPIRDGITEPVRIDVKSAVSPGVYSVTVGGALTVQEVISKCHIFAFVLPDGELDLIPSDDERVHFSRFSTKRWFDWDRATKQWTLRNKK